jgi:hypothetical protein
MDSSFHVNQEMRLVNSAIIGDVSREIRRKIYVCPACGEALEPAELQQPAGIGGGTYCPKCGERVYVSSPYPKLSCSSFPFACRRDPFANACELGYLIRGRDPCVMVAHISVPELVLNAVQAFYP